MPHQRHGDDLRPGAQLGAVAQLPVHADPGGDAGGAAPLLHLHRSGEPVTHDLRQKVCQEGVIVLVLGDFIATNAYYGYIEFGDLNLIIKLA